MLDALGDTDTRKREVPSVEESSFPWPHGRRNAASGPGSPTFRVPSTVWWLERSPDYQLQGQRTETENRKPPSLQRDALLPCRDREKGEKVSQMVKATQGKITFEKWKQHHDDKQSPGRVIHGSCSPRGEQSLDVSIHRARVCLVPLALFERYLVSLRYPCYLGISALAV